MPTCQHSVNLEKHLKIIIGDQRLFLEKRVITGNRISSSAVLHILFCPKGLSDSSSFKEEHSFKANHFCTRVKLQAPLSRIPVTLGGHVHHISELEYLLHCLARWIWELGNIYAVFLFQQGLLHFVRQHSHKMHHPMSGILEIERKHY